MCDLIQGFDVIVVREWSGRTNNLRYLGQSTRIGGQQSRGVAILLLLDIIRKGLTTYLQCIKYNI